MPDAPVIAFTPVPLRRRADGWSADLQLRFIVALSRGLSPGEAARSVGKNRQNAYALRKRRGAESFTAAWDAVVAHVRQSRAAASAPPPPGPGRTMLHGAEAEAVAERGAEAVRRAPDLAAGRRALGDMLDALYGPKSDNSDTAASEEKAPMESRNL